MAYVVTVLVGLVFGGVDQYLGSNPSWGIATAVSLMSAPWLLMPFFVGMSQRRARRAAVLGIVVTLSALVGYGFMVLGPLQYHGGRSEFDWPAVRGLLVSQVRYVVAGAVIGPLYGYLGHRWRIVKSWTTVVLAGGLLVFEPLTRLAGLEYGTPLAFVFELAAGVVLVGYLVQAKIRSASACGQQSGAVPAA